MDVKKLFVIPLLAAILLLLGSVLVSASSVTVNVPAAAAEINGTVVNYNLTINVSEGDHAGSGLVNISILSGSTVLDYDDSVNYTEGITLLEQRNISTTGLTDGAITLTVNVYNQTGIAATETRSVTVDNTAPASITASYRESIRRAASMTADFGSTDVTTVTYSTTLVDPDGNTVSGFPKTGSSVSIGGDEIGMMGAYVMTMTATDNVGKSTATSYTIQVTSSTTASSQVVKGTDVVRKQASGQDSALMFMGAGIVIIILLIMFGAMAGKKGRR